MKKILIYTMLVMFITISCKKEKIDLYSSDNYISFLNTQNDTIVLSFFLMGNLSEVDYPIEVRYTGIPKEEETFFKVKMDENSSSYLEDMVSFNEENAFRSMLAVDTFYVNFKNYDILKEETKIVTLYLENNDDFILGDEEYRKITFKINDNVAKPDWWDSKVDKYFLGEYSELKFRKLMEFVEPDLSFVDMNMIRSWAIDFKIVLDQKREEGTPIMEADGNPMIVPVSM